MEHFAKQPKITVALGNIAAQSDCDGVANAARLGFLHVDLLMRG